MQTMRRTTLALAAALAFGFGTMAVGAQDSSLDDIAEDGARLLRLAETLEVIEKSILLTEQPCESLGKRWTNYTPLNGRFALATGKGKDDRGEERMFEHDDRGGVYAHPLTVSEMPEHRHSYSDRYQKKRRADYGDDEPSEAHEQKNRSTGNEGGGEPHENMPPYLVLNFCYRQ